MDWAAGIVELAAQIIVGQKRWWGYILHIISGVLWTIVALHAGVYGLLTITIPAFGINVYNLVKWWGEDHVEEG